MINGMDALDTAIDMMSTSPPPSCAVLNDDIPTPLRPAAAVLRSREIAKKFTDWLANKWPVPGEWEWVD